MVDGETSEDRISRHEELSLLVQDLPVKFPGSENEERSDLPSRVRSNNGHQRFDTGNTMHAATGMSEPCAVFKRITSHPQ